jgi:hypothetical protein
LAEAAAKELAWIGTKVAELLEAKARLRALIFDFMPRLKGNEVVQYWREREMRDSLRGRPQLERDMTFLQAAQRLDGESMRALLDGPGCPWISGEVRSRGEELYASRRNAEAFETLRDLGVYEEHLQGVRDHAARVLLTINHGTDPARIKEFLGVLTEEPVHA